VHGTSVNLSIIWRTKMKSIGAVTVAAALSFPTLSALAQEPAKHDEHHPIATTQKKAPAKPADQAAKADAQLQAMREMHEKMMSAKSPDERKALMAEHMKTMQDSMSMMHSMAGTGTASAKTMSPQAMQKQMDMMKMMMQMMMDRMDGTMPAPAK
jgi:hypothetical protein